jgi:hypothetical protein
LEKRERWHGMAGPQVEDEGNGLQDICEDNEQAVPNIK